jgi:DnaJ-class molecular chaperone
MNDLYERLGVERGAGVADIRRAHLRAAKEHHPDRGGDPEKFKKIQQAYEVLSDPEKRRMYDMTGQIPGEQPPPQEVPVGAGGMPGFPFPVDLNDIFKMFPGAGMGGGGSGPVRRVPKGPSKTDRLPLSLEQFYYGHTIRMSFDRMKLCGECAGSGAASKSACGGCKGSGQVMRTMMMGPVVMHSSGPCGDCSGSGEKTVRLCEACGGKGKVQEVKHLDVRIEPGMKAGDAMRFEEACSESVEYERAGDVVIILEDAGSAVGWARKGADLHLEIVIGLVDSLVGCVHTLDEHPKVREGEEPVRVRVPAGVVTGDVLVVEDYGMPVKGGGFGVMHLTVRVMADDRERAALRLEANRGKLLEIFGRPDLVVDGALDVRIA